MGFGVGDDLNSRGSSDLTRAPSGGIGGCIFCISLIGMSGSIFHGGTTTGTFFLSQAVARIMVDKQTAGRIVNVSSVHAVVSEPNAAPYTATKGGLEAMSRTMASELAPHGITVNCVRPGATRTKMSEPIYTPQIVRSLEAKIPLGLIAPPEWVASAICYLASGEACYTTGACLDVDGGYAMDGSLPGTAYS